MIKKGRCIYIALFLAFLIGNYNGYIALWTENSKKPDMVFPYRVSSLPPADQAALEKGIELTSREELRQLLEDYLS